MRRIHDILAMQLYDRVVVLGSITKAAQAMGISLATASKRLARLESDLETKLVYRNTRTLSITDEGRLFHMHVQRILAEIDAAEQVVQNRHSEVTGTLRITAPHSFARRYLTQIIPQFSKRYPDVTFQLIFGDDIRDLIEDNIDIAIRYGRLTDSRLVARTLCSNVRILCASPEYLEKTGIPETLEDLNDHQCIVLGDKTEAVWKFEQGEVSLSGFVCCNDGETAHALAVASMGIILKSKVDVQDDLNAGRLAAVLPKMSMESAPINVVFPTHALMAPRIRLFIDFLQDALNGLPTD